MAKQALYIDATGAVRWDRRSPDRTTDLRLVRVYQVYRMLQEVERSIPADSREEELAIRMAAGLLRVTT